MKGDDDEKIFCKKCEQRIIPRRPGIFGFGKKGMIYYEFKDGDYCEKCAKIIIEEKRAKK